MQPQQEIDPDVREQNQADEKACLERIQYSLNKYGCALDGMCIIKNGFTQIQIGVVKIPPEVRRAQREAKRSGHPADAPAVTLANGE